MTHTLERIALADSNTSSITSDETCPNFTLQDTPLQEIVHTALQLRSDLQDPRGHDAGWHGIDNDHVAEKIPKNLHLFMSALFRGGAILEAWDEQETTDDLQTKLCSIAKDIIFAPSKSRKLQPKHIGLGLALHQDYSLREFGEPLPSC